MHDDHGNATPLALAARNGHFRAAKYLISHGTDIAAEQGDSDKPAVFPADEPTSGLQPFACVVVVVVVVVVTVAVRTTGGSRISR